LTLTFFIRRLQTFFSISVTSCFYVFNVFKIFYERLCIYGIRLMLMIKPVGTRGWAQVLYDRGRLLSVDRPALTDVQRRSRRVWSPRVDETEQNVFSQHVYKPWPLIYSDRPPPACELCGHPCPSA